MITSIDQLDLNKKYSYADYLTWHNEEYWEILRGKVVKRSSSCTNHQLIVGNLGFRLYEICKSEKYELFFMPIDVCLYTGINKMPDEFIYTVVQPDICVICDTSKMEERACFGAPDFIIEVLSEGTEQKDIIEKFNIYEQYGVKEYWIVSYLKETIFAFDLNKNRFQLREQFIGNETIIQSKTINEYSFQLGELFSKKLYFPVEQNKDDLGLINGILNIE